MAHIIITGGSSGIGAALAEASAARGHDVSLIARTEVPLLARLRDLQARNSAAARFHAEIADIARWPGDSGRNRKMRGRARTMWNTGHLGRDRRSRHLRQPTAGDIRTPDPHQFPRHGQCRARGLSRYEVPAKRQHPDACFGRGTDRHFRLLRILRVEICGSRLCRSTEGRSAPFGISVSICFPPDTETPQLNAEIPLRPPEAQAAIGAGGLWSAEAVAQDGTCGARTKAVRDLPRHTDEDARHVRISRDAVPAAVVRSQDRDGAASTPSRRLILPLRQPASGGMTPLRKAKAAIEAALRRSG